MTYDPQSNPVRVPAPQSCGDNNTTISNDVTMAEMSSWAKSIPITPANIDLAFVDGGFGGTATLVGGASYTNVGP